MSLLQRLIGKKVEGDDERSDQEWKRRITTWWNESKQYHDWLRQFQDIAEAYYLGEQTMRYRVPRYMSDAVDNIIFRDVETLVPMITGNTPEMVSVPAQETETAAKDAENVQRMLNEVFRNEDVEKKVEMATRQMLIRRFGVLKVRWDKEAATARIHAVDNRRIYIPRFGQTVTDLPYLIEYHEFTKDEWEEFFGQDKKQAAIAKNAQPQDMPEQEQSGKPKDLFRVLEVWTNEDHVWAQLSGDVIRKEKNPLLAAEMPYVKHLKKPYAFISTFETTGRLVGETCAVEQSMPLQDIVNVVTRQIANNATKMSNGTWLVDSSVMSEEKAKTTITNAPGLIIWGQGAANPNLIRRDAPQPIPEYLLALRQDAKNAIDTIFGTNSTTRGERSGPETKAGRLILREADMARSDIYRRPIATAMEDLGNLVLLYFAAYGEEKMNVPVLDEDGTLSTVEKFSAQMVKDSVKQVIVISGNTKPKDPINQHNEIMDMYAAGLIDQMTALEKLGTVGNPREVVERQIAIKSGQVPVNPDVAPGVPVPAGMPGMMQQAPAGPIPPVIP